MRVLVVDDDPLAAEMTAAVLEDAGFEAVQAESGTAALEVLSTDPSLELVVSDMNMPGISGLQCFQALRARGDERPFVLLSGDDPQALRASEPGLDACVRKDFDLESTLGQAIADVLAARRP